MHRTTDRFWQRYWSLPKEVQALAGGGRRRRSRIGKAFDEASQRPFGLLSWVGQNRPRRVT